MDPDDCDEVVLDTMAAYYGVNALSGLAALEATDVNKDG